VAGDTLAQMKPAPEPLLHACRVLDADLARCVVVGDSALDVAAARAARMPVVIVRYGYPGDGGHAALQCDGFVDSFAELPAMLGCWGCWGCT
jgi:phosphoglycolate phosphatase